LRALASSVRAAGARTKNGQPGVEPALRTLIDPLDQRLLFSADHPLGLAVGSLDIEDDRTQSEDAALVASTLARLELQRQADATEPDDENLKRILNDDVDRATITVSTTQDIIDAPDLTSLAALNADKGDDGKISLREAILVANSDASVGEIYLPNGDYQLTEGDPSDYFDIASEGDLDLGLDPDAYPDANTGYAIRGESQELTIIDQEVAERRIFEVRFIDVDFSDLTITGGDRSETSVGAGVFVNSSSSTATFTNVTFHDNNGALRGGAIFTNGTVRRGYFQR